jgi:hypothetical protein
MVLTGNHMFKWLSKLNNFLFPTVVAFELNTQQKDALQRMTFDSDRYLDKKEALKAKLVHYQDTPEWNPLKDIRFDTGYESEDILFLSDTIISLEVQDPFFKRYCSNILRYLILYVSKIPSRNALALDYIYSLIVNTKNIPDLLIKIGFSCPSERELLEKWHLEPAVGMQQLALCLKPFVIKKFSKNVLSLL